MALSASVAILFSSGTQAFCFSFGGGGGNKHAPYSRYVPPYPPPYPGMNYSSAYQMISPDMAYPPVYPMPLQQQWQQPGWRLAPVQPGM